MNNKTINYYNKYTKSFIQTTRSVDFTNIQNKFLSYLPSGASILDFGCGSGRDTKYFIKRNYNVTAIDGSEEICKEASKYTGIKVKQMLFEELKCTGVEFEHLKAIPASNTFSFTPKGKLEEYLLYAVMLRGNLAQRYEEWGSMPFVKQVK